MSNASNPPFTSTTLNWSALSEEGEQAPWVSLRQFAAAIVTDESLVERLSAFYREATAKPLEEQHLEWLTVPAVFALAGPKASLAARQAMTRTMLTALRGFDEDSDIEFEMAQMTIGRQGPAVLPLIIEELAVASPEQDGWMVLWALLELVGETRDPELQAAVRDCCRAALQRVLDGKLKHEDAIFVGHALALTGHRESAPLLAQVIATAPKADSYLGMIGINDLKAALENLQNPASRKANDPYWKRSLVTAVEADWEAVLKWRMRQDEGGDDAEDGDDADAADAQDDGGSDEESEGGEAVAPLSTALLREIFGGNVGAAQDDTTPTGKVRRNDPCPCGSGKKFKRCCMIKSGA